jgi:hypothetical protein
MPAVMSPWSETRGARPTVCMYVDFTGRIRMDIDNSRLVWDQRQK